MFRKILIANRGEVAARVLRTAHRLGVKVVAVASAPDRDLGWLKEADEVVILGGTRSYLDADAILEAARRTGATAIHPGWGFLSENATFSARCAALGITFIGPGPGLIRAMGDKVLARQTMGSLGMPLIPGSPGPVASVDEAKAVADQVGWPVLLKASAGGGGRGMRRVYSAEGLADAFASASGEASSAFGNGELYLEHLVVGGRHIEFQIIADAFGHAVHVGERECSIQRRHQKLIEESPSPVVSAEQRAQVGELVASVVAKAGYRNAGTVEMLRGADGRLFFMEMNTRLQVEHPVSEMISGLDLVELQLRVAANQALPLRQAPTLRGHAIEARINAEDPANGFQPCPGRIARLRLPEGEGIRVDTHLREGDSISPHYDSMICKLIAWGEDRAQALARLEAALRSIEIDGVKTTIPLHLYILGRPEFKGGTYDTSSLEKWMAEPDFSLEGV